MLKLNKITKSEFLNIILPATLSMILFIVAIFTIVLPSLEKSIMEKKEEGIRNIIYTVWNDLRYHDYLVQSGQMTLEQAQEEFKNHIEFMRYGKEMKDYIWINDMHPTMITHPYRSDLDGKDLTNYKDPDGKRLFVESVKIVKAHDEGFLNYMWQWKDDSTKVVPKISFVKLFKPWNWIIGTGIYIDDVQAEVAVIQHKVILLSVGILFFILILQAFLINKSIEINTKRTLAENSLRKSEKRFKDLTDLLPQMVFEIDKLGFFTYANRFAYRFTGYTPFDIKNGLHVSQLFNPDDNKRISHRIKQILRGMKSQGQEYTLRKKDGCEAIVSVYTNPIYLNERPHGIRGIAVDITESKKLQALSVRAQRLEVAGRIAGQVAHDFNNLLGPLMAYPELIRKRLAEDHPVHHYIDKIETAAAYIAEMNQQLLTLSRRGHYNQAPLDINEVVNQVVHQIQPVSSKITFNMNLVKNPMPVKGGAAQINRIFLNLISNGIEAMDGEGTITVTTDNYYQDRQSGKYHKIPKGEYIKVTISDTGHGIPSDILPKIFDPFFTTKLSDKKKGSGLGLTVVHSIMEDHGGYIDYSSEINIGTTFYMYFPITREKLVAQEEQKIVGGNESVLVVDDDEMQREVTTKLLDDLGYDVMAADCGEKAHELMRHENYDLLLLDMIMPGHINGTETYRRAIEIRPGQKAIIVSGYAENEQVQQALDLGAGAFIKKPLTLKSLAHAVRAELDKSKHPETEQIQTTAH